MKRRARRNPEIIRTDNKWHDFKYRNEVPKSVLRREFDWVDPEQEGLFIHYQRGWLHLAQFEWTGRWGWNGTMNTSATTAILVKVSSDGEKYKIGSARWQG